MDYDLYMVEHETENITDFLSYIFSILIYFVHNTDIIQLKLLKSMYNGNY